MWQRHPEPRRRRAPPRPRQAAPPTIAFIAVAVRAGIEPATPQPGRFLLPEPRAPADACRGFGPRAGRPVRLAFAQEQLGDIVFVELPEVGITVQKGDEAATIESVKAASEFFTPVSGKVININNTIIDDPGLINSDPREVGWFFSLELADPSELENLMDEAAYESFVTSLS